MFFSDEFRQYLKRPLVQRNGVEDVEIDRLKFSLYRRLTSIARKRALADPSDTDRTHGILLVYGDFSGEITTVDPPKEPPLSEIIGQNTSDRKFNFQHPRTKESISYNSLTQLLDGCSFVDFAWLIHLDGTIIGPGHDLDCAKGIQTEPSWGKGTKTAKSYSGNAHAIATYKLSEDIGKRVLMFDNLKLVRDYEPYRFIHRK